LFQIFALFNKKKSSINPKIFTIFARRWMREQDVRFGSQKNFKTHRKNSKFRLLKF